MNITFGSNPDAVLSRIQQTTTAATLMAARRVSARATGPAGRFNFLSAGLAKTCICHISATLLVLRHPPATAEDRFEWKTRKLPFAAVAGAKHITRGHISAEGSKVSVSPPLSFAKPRGGNLKAQCLKGKRKLLLIDEYDLVRIRPRVQVVPTEDPIGELRSFCPVIPNDVFCHRVDGRSRLNGLQLLVDVMANGFWSVRSPRTSLKRMIRSRLLSERVRGFPSSSAGQFLSFGMTEPS